MKKLNKVGKLTGKQLQDVLWSTVVEVRSGKLKAKDANAVCSVSREICRIAKLQIDFAKATNSKTLSRDVFV